MSEKLSTAKSNHDQPVAAITSAEQVSPPPLRRKTYYITGFDPRSVRQYHRMYVQEAAKQAAISPWQYQVSGRCENPDRHWLSWHITTRNDVDQVVAETDYHVLNWGDTIKEYWRLPKWRLIMQCLKRCVTNRFGAVNHALWRYHTYAWITYNVPAIYGLAWLLALLLVIAGLWASVASSWWCLLLAGLGVGAGVLLWRYESRLMAFWVVRAIMFSERFAQGKVVPLYQQCDHWSAAIAADCHNPDVDEVLVVAHSHGCPLAVRIMAQLHRRHGMVAHPKLALVWLGQTAGLQVFDRRRTRDYRCDVLDSLQAPAIARNITAFADPVSAAGCSWLADEFGDQAKHQSGVAAWINPGFHKLMTAESYQRLKGNFFDYHFHYIKAMELWWDKGEQGERSYDFFALTAGNLRLVQRFPPTARILPTPPYPQPITSKRQAYLRIIRGKRSFIHYAKERSFSAKLSRITTPSLVVWYLNDVKIIRRVMVSTADKYPKHWLWSFMLEPLIGNGLFISNGAEWRRQRAMIEGAFEITKLRRAFPLMLDAVMAMVDRLTQVSASDRERLYVDSILTQVTADIIFRTILSQQLSDQDAHKIFTAFNYYQEQAGTMTLLKCYQLPTWWHRRKVAQAASEIRGIVGSIVSKRYESYRQGLQQDPHYSDQHDDILGRLLEARDPETQQAMSCEELIDQVCVFFLAGHETSASALTWTLYSLANDQQSQAKAYQEIKSVFAGRDQLDFADIAQLKWTHDVFREALRLYPPVPFFMRQALSAEEMRGKSIAAGDIINISPWFLHRHGDYWRDPHCFDPQRFRDGSCSDAIKQAFIPFGVGPRSCTGAAFATQESMLILSHILRRYHLRVIPGEVPEPVSRLTIRPLNGVHLRFFPRDENCS